jgi:succinate dehydrogenase (ubiquinone) membrane anchor subunit
MNGRLLPALRRLPSSLTVTMTSGKTALRNISMCNAVLFDKSTGRSIIAHQNHITIIGRQLATESPTASGEQLPHNHAKQFFLERFWAAAMLPVLPAAYFIHTPMMDFLLSIALVMHIHWGLHGVTQDYARPFVIGETWAKLANATIYMLSVLLFAGLMRFNYNDVGLTKAFELVWSV